MNMKKILLLTMIILAFISVKKIYLDKSIPSDSISKKISPPVATMDEIKEKMFKKKGNHFTVFDLSKTEKFKDKTGFLVASYTFELIPSKKNNYIKIIVQNKNRKNTTSKNFKNIKLKVGGKILSVFSGQNGIYYSKIIEDKTLLNKKNLEIIIWGEYKTNSFSGKISVNFSENKK